MGNRGSREAGLPTGGAFSLASRGRVREWLSSFAEQLRADEIMIKTAIFDHAARRRSYALLADAFGLQSIPWTQPEPAVPLVLRMREKGFAASTAAAMIWGDRSPRRRKPMTAAAGMSRRNLSLEAARADATARYVAANPESARRIEAASDHLPGGNTRSILHFSPFPLVLAGGEGATLVDVDGHRYADFLGEYTAGIYGHSHPAILAAVKEALAQGITLGGPNRYEARLGQLICERFPSVDLVRFCNSGTEATLNALCAARAHTGRSHTLFFNGAYHGGVFTFAGGGAPMNAPFPQILATYNDLAGTAALIEQHAPTLAAVIIEPMMGAAGAIPADPEFLQMLREHTRRHGIVLVFDEVMTSRLSPGGLQLKRNVVPDLTTFGKYLGGGITFGAFGGATSIMMRFDPRRPDAFGHSGTYNNNVLSMAAGVAGLEQALTADAVIELNRKGDDLRRRLNEVFERHGVAIQMLGEGSIGCLHFHKRRVRHPGDVQNDPVAQTLFHLEMLERGIYLARRGFITLSLPLTAADYDRFVAAAEEFAANYAHLLPA